MIYLVELYEINDESKIIDLWAFSNEHERLSFIVNDLAPHINYAVYNFRETETELDRSWSINHRYAREYIEEISNES